MYTAYHSPGRKQSLFPTQAVISCVHDTETSSPYIFQRHIHTEQYNTWNNSTISRKLLKMNVLTFETCCAVNGEIIKQVASSRSIFIQSKGNLANYLFFQKQFPITAQIYKQAPPVYRCLKFYIRALYNCLRYWQTDSCLCSSFQRMVFDMIGGVSSHLVVCMWLL